MAAVLLLVVTAPAAPAAAEYPWFTLHSKLNDKCLETKLPSYNGQRANMWSCWGGWNQQWKWSGDQLVNRSTGKCLEILDVNPNNGSYVGEWDCWPGVNQRWYMGDFLPVPVGQEVRNRLNAKCLEIRDSWPGDGAYVGMWDCWRGAATAWQIVY
ncbi:RICIN domain-containing protein [Micromonospora wenchangensis]|nr:MULTISPECIES: RICIN domain-containing protein [Micromonospora]